MPEKIMQEILQLQKMVLNISEKIDSLSSRMDEMEFLISLNEDENANKNNQEYQGWEQVEDYHQDFLEEYDEDDEEF